MCSFLDCLLGEITIHPSSPPQDSSRPPSADGDLLANHAHHNNQKRNSGRRHNAKNSNNVPQTTDESFHLLETGKNKSDNDEDVAGNFRYEASWLNCPPDEDGVHLMGAVGASFPPRKVLNL